MRTFLLLLLCSPLVFAGSAEDSVRAAETSFGAALVHSDTAALERLLNADLFYGHASGKSDSKQTYIARIRDGSQKYVSFQYDPTPPVVHLYGNTATLITSAEVQSVTDGQPNQLHMRFLHVWIHNGAGWQLVAHQSVRLNSQ